MNGKILYMALLLTVSAAGNESAENMRGIEFCFPTAARLLTPRPCSSVVLHIKVGRKLAGNIARYTRFLPIYRLLTALESISGCHLRSIVEEVVGLIPTRSTITEFRE